MPGMNGKGPLGKGPQSGGQRGVCKQTGIAKPDQHQGPPTDTISGQVPGRGQDLGQGGACRGGQCGGGKGQGRGGSR